MNRLYGLARGLSDDSAFDDPEPTAEVIALCACIPATQPHIASVNSKHRKTPEAVFRDPVSGSIPWADIEALLRAAGCEVVEGRGSRVRLVKAAEVENFHRPRPAKEAKRYQVEAARGYLIRLGVRL
jgi:hypothetical protein